MVEHQRELLIGDIDLWLCDPAEVTDQGLLARYRALLTDEEEGKRARYLFEKDRHRYLVTRAMIRTLLSQYGKREPARWRFTANRWNKPEIDGRQNPGNLRFNISHTGGLICCVFTRSLDIGVDVENITRRAETVKIAHRYFSLLEVQALVDHPQTSQRERFFDYWTLKESYIKACGMGLAIALRDFSFIFNRSGTVDIRFAGSRKDDPGLWNFSTMTAATDFRLSIAIKGHDARVSPRLQIIKGLPSGEWEPVELPVVFPFRQ